MKYSNCPCGMRLSINKRSSAVRLYRNEVFRQVHGPQVDEALEGELLAPEGRWLEAIAAGDFAFVENVKAHLVYQSQHVRSSKEAE
jgi:hypothetical protein